jgi:hypothetical protein
LTGITVQKVRISVATLLLSIGVTASHAEQKTTSQQIKFPIVITSASQLRPFGLAVIFGSATYPRLDHQCYWYNDLISVSHERLTRYRELGFTLNSLCLGLISGTLFDPETGRRLPTFITFNQKEFEENRKRTPILDRDDYVSQEHPLELPKCFSRALPFSDCVFNFDRLTGKPLSKAKRERFRAYGQRIKSAMDEAIKRRVICTPPFCHERWTADPPDGDNSVLGSLDAENGCFNLGYLGRFLEQVLRPKGIATPSENEVDELGVTCFDISLNLPATFGYTTDADGMRSPTVSPEIVAIAADPSRSAAQIDVESLAASIRPTPTARSGPEPQRPAR